VQRPKLLNTNSTARRLTDEPVENGPWRFRDHCSRDWRGIPRQYRRLRSGERSTLWSVRLEARLPSEIQCVSDATSRIRALKRHRRYWRKWVGMSCHANPYYKLSNTTFGKNDHRRRKWLRRRHLLESICSRSGRENGKRAILSRTEVISVEQSAASSRSLRFDGCSSFHGSKPVETDRSTPNIPLLPDWCLRRVASRVSNGSKPNGSLAGVPSARIAGS
jgi:hypothetical protein